MPTQSLGPNYRTPFGKNVYLRSTDPKPRTESYTCAKSTVPTVTIDGHTDQKVLQPGTVMAKITSGTDSGKVGPYDDAATDGRQTETNIVGINDTFLPWQLMERDVEIAVVYDAAVITDRCYELASGAFTALTTAAAKSALKSNPGLNITLHTASTEV
jgi:hypothetical protein